MGWRQKHVYFLSKIGDLSIDRKSKTIFRFPLINSTSYFDNETHSHNLFFQSNDISLLTPIITKFVRLIPRNPVGIFESENIRCLTTASLLNYSYLLQGNVDEGSIGGYRWM
jgi:hypothetical protein